MVVWGRPVVREFHPPGRPNRFIYQFPTVYVRSLPCQADQNPPSEGMTQTVLYVAASETDADQGATALEDAGPLAVEPAVSLGKVESYAAGVDCVVFAETPTTTDGAHLLEVIEACGETPLVLYSRGEYGPTAARSTEGIDGYVRRERAESFGHLADEVVWNCADGSESAGTDAGDLEVLEGLHGMVTEARDCDDDERILAAATETAAEVVGEECAYLIFEDGEMRPQAGPTEEARSPIADGVANEALARGESILIEDVDGHWLTGNAGGYRSIVAVPCDAGVFRLVAEEAGAFDEGDLEVLEVLATLVAGVLSEERPEPTHNDREVTTRNDRLEEVTQIVSQDLPAPLNVAEGYLEVATETGDQTHLEEVERAHGRLRECLEDLRGVVRRPEVIDAIEPVAVCDVARRAWSTVETGEASLETGEDALVEADKARLIEVFEELVRRSLATTEGEPTVRVGATPAGFFLENDGGSALETDDLETVEQVAEAHGWTVTVRESDGGTRVAFTGVETDVLETDIGRAGPVIDGRSCDRI